MCVNIETVVSTPFTFVNLEINKQGHFSFKLHFWIKFLQKLYSGKITSHAFTPEGSKD